MSDVKVFGVEQGIALIAADGSQVAIIHSHTYSVDERALLNSAEINSIALGLIGGTSGVWQKVTNTNTPTTDYKKLATSDEISALTGQTSSAINWRPEVPHFAHESEAQFLERLNANNGAGIYLEGTISAGSSMQISSVSLSSPTYVIFKEQSSLKRVTKTGNVWATTTIEQVQLGWTYASQNTGGNFQIASLTSSGWAYTVTQNQRDDLYTKKEKRHQRFFDVAVNSADASPLFTVANFNGKHDFSYRATDMNGQTTFGNVSIGVNESAGNTEMVIQHYGITRVGNLKLVEFVGRLSENFELVVSATVASGVEQYLTGEVMSSFNQMEDPY